MKTKKRGVKPTVIKTEKAIENYYNKNKKSLENKDISLDDLKAWSEEYLDKQYNGIGRANKAIKEMITEQSLSNDEYELVQKIKTAKENFSGDTRIFNNKKYGDFKADNLGTYYDTIGNKYEITGYHEIENSPYILATVQVTPVYGSPYETEQYLEGSVYGV